MACRVLTLLERVERERRRVRRVSLRFSLSSEILSAKSHPIEPPAYRHITPVLFLQQSAPSALLFSLSALYGLNCDFLSPCLCVCVFIYYNDVISAAQHTLYTVHK